MTEELIGATVTSVSDRTMTLLTRNGDEATVKLMPVEHCESCGEVADTSSEASYTRDGVSWTNAFQENQRLVKCVNPSCSDYTVIKVYDELSGERII